MKLLSLNIRSVGKGRESKFGDFKKICRTIKPTIVALQETKLHSVKDSWICSLWGSNDCKFVQKEMVGKSGDFLDVFDTFVCDFFIGMRGLLKSSARVINIINVYGPHTDVDKQRMWNALSNDLYKSIGEAYVLCGDFNEVREEGERFNLHLAHTRGRKFTRVSDDGVKYSKLERFLVTEEFNSLWKNLKVVALERKISDHCPILLKDEDKNFGPKPIKVFDEWLKVEGIENVIRDSWNEAVTVTLRRDNLFRIKLKRLKLQLKDNCNPTFGQIDSDIDTYKEIALKLELKAETDRLNENEEICGRKQEKFGRIKKG
ncbi:uncharacterized protein [Rutidosis leptorrhynchoides]|uniref:uncharacterized protein n=1 Tax=Rutidosis leptorrhynchoides TaxID=125765 RepID=UPI003A98E19C